MGSEMFKQFTQTKQRAIVRQPVKKRVVSSDKEKREGREGERGGGEREREREREREVD